MLTRKTDGQFVKELYKGFKFQVMGIMQCLDDILHGSGLEAHIFEAHRSDERQYYLYSFGRMRKGTKRTNAKPGQSAHNIYADAEKTKPAAMAVDIWLTLSETTTYRGETRNPGAILFDGHPAWAAVPFAAWEVAGEKVNIGAMFRIGQGDWPHIELADWRELTHNGVLR